MTKPQNPFFHIFNHLHQTGKQLILTSDRAPVLRQGMEEMCIRDSLRRFRERNLFLRGLVPLIGYQTDSVYYNRDKRFAGESKYPFRKRCV